MKKIFKYHLPEIETTIELPEGYKILSLHEQKGNVYVWVLVDPNITTFKKATFKIFGTGQEINNVDNMDYVGTVFLDNGMFVFHVFLEK